MKNIVLCGSLQKAEHEMEHIADILRLTGAQVVTPKSMEGETNQKRQIEAHYKAIEQADLVVFINPKGYLGINSTAELGYAKGLKKEIHFLYPEKDEPCRQILKSL